MDLSIIIVNYNTKELTSQTINSIIDNTQGINYEIIVVDNSSDKSQLYNSMNDDIRIYQVENHGFGHGCNSGARQATGKYLLFLNSDTLIHGDSLAKCVAYLNESDKVGVLGARVLLEDGILDHGCKRGFPTPGAAFYYYLGLDKIYPQSRKYGAYRQTFLNEYEINEVDSVSGAFLIMPKYLFDEVNGFDEEFFMYGEDLDLCYRIKEKGYKVIYFPGAVITHLKGQSGLHTSSKIVIYHFYNAMIIFYNKHYKYNYNILVTVLVYLAIKLKYMLTLIKWKKVNK